MSASSQVFYTGSGFEKPWILAWLWTSSSQILLAEQVLVYFVSCLAGRPIF